MCFQVAGEVNQCFKDLLIFNTIKKKNRFRLYFKLVQTCIMETGKRNQFIILR